jgi:hypothetical protein
MEQVYDALNNQFLFYDEFQDMGSGMVEYLENNNINLNYYCFYSKVIDKVYHIITSNTTKRKNNGYRLITIQRTENSNSICEHDGNTTVIFENILIKVTPIIVNINEIASKFNIIIKDVDIVSNNKKELSLSFEYLHSKNIKEENVLEICNAYKLKHIHHFKNLETISGFIPNQCFIKSIPNSLKTLTFGDMYNQIIDSNFLPKFLETLTFGSTYNQIIGENVLPSSLQTLIFGYEYNKIININVLPITLKTLIFEEFFNQPIVENVLPNSLQTLVLGSHFNHIIKENILPNSFKTLKLSGFYDHPITENILPNSLQKLKFGYIYNHAITENILPNSLKKLTFGYTYNHAVSKHLLPNSLKKLTFGIEFNQIIDENTLPNSLETLGFKFTYNHIINENILPETIKEIKFNNYDLCKKRDKHNIIPQKFHSKIKYTH